MIYDIHKRSLVEITFAQILLKNTIVYRIVINFNIHKQLYLTKVHVKITFKKNKTTVN